jgi:drug/metabolite transporter (DMT)-like permease
VTIILASLSALLYGLADFSGGWATRRNAVFSVMLVSQAAGLAVALAAAPLVGPNAPTIADFAWGLAAGLSGAAGISFLYRGLAAHEAAVVSPLSALVGAVVPAAFGLALGESPSTLGKAGALLCLPAIVLLSWESGARGPRGAARASLLHGLGAGLGFGGFFILVSRSSSGSGLWPLVAARVGSLSAIAIMIASRRERPSVGRADWPIALFAGAADMAANVLFLLATRSGLLVLTTVVTSLYPAPTVLLAVAVGGQRLTVPKAAGIAVAIAGVALIGLR